MKDTSAEIERIQFEIMMKLGPDKRIEFGCEMFMLAREMILASLPEGLSEREKRKRYFKKMYGFSLPKDFFKEDSDQEQL